MDDLKARIKIDADLDYDLMDLRDHIRNLGNYYQDPHNHPVPKKQLDNNFQGGIDLLNVMLDQSSGEFLNGDHLTLSDLSVFSSIHEAIKSVKFDLKSNPRVEKWYKKIGNVSAVKELLSKF